MIYLLRLLFVIEIINIGELKHECYSGCLACCLTSANDKFLVSHQNSGLLSPKYIFTIFLFISINTFDLK